MLYSVSNPPDFTLLCSDEEKDIASKAANKILLLKGTDEEAIFSAKNAVRIYKSKLRHAQKPQDQPKRQLPSHVSNILNKASQEAVVASKEPDQVINQTSNDLIDVKLNRDKKLIHKFEDGSQIVTDLSPLGKKTVNQTVVANGTSAINKVVIQDEEPADFGLWIQTGLGECKEDFSFWFKK